MAKSFDNREGWIWMNGSFIPWKDATSHVISQGLHYASSVFEGERAYNGKIFKSKEHTERLFKSAEILSIKKHNILTLNHGIFIWLVFNDYKNFSIVPNSFWTSKKTNRIENELISVFPETVPQSKAEDYSKHVTIKASMIGTFYRSSGQDQDAFVNVGDEIKEGSVICIIEAMKLFNEIESEISGKIVKVLVDDNTPVEFDQPLFLVDPS